MHAYIKVEDFENCKRAGSVWSNAAEERRNIFWLIQLFLKESSIALSLPSIAHCRREVAFAVQQQSCCKHLVHKGI